MITKLRDWILRYTYEFGVEPKFVPINGKEVWQVRSEGPVIQIMEPTNSSKILGIEPFDTPFSVEMRKRTLDEKCFAVSESVNLKELEFDYSKSIDRMQHRLQTYLATDTTIIPVKFSYDPWKKIREALPKWLARKFHKQLKPLEFNVIIEGVALYPYLKLTLPSNRHRVKFSVKSSDSTCHLG